MSGASNGGFVPLLHATCACGEPMVEATERSVGMNVVTEYVYKLVTEKCAAGHVSEHYVGETWTKPRV